MVVIRDSLFNILEILNSVERKNKILIREKRRKIKRENSMFSPSNLSKITEHSLL